MKRMFWVKEWLDAFVSLFFPRCCVVCGKALGKEEEALCIRCNLSMPRTGYHLRTDNPVEQLFYGKVNIERATSYFFYRKNSDFRNILHLFKYKGQKELAETMGRQMAAELSIGGFFDGIDVIVPVPLHPIKERLRGYNQSEWIARGISAITDIPCSTDNLIRQKNTETQTKKNAEQRWENVQGIFHFHHPENLVNKHILLVDDVLTTGATTFACASSLEAIEGIRISILTLAVAEGG